MARWVPGEGDEHELGATPVSRYNILDARESRIVSWRVECFQDLGLAFRDALSLAERKDVDRVDVERASRAGATAGQLLELFL